VLRVAELVNQNRNISIDVGRSRATCNGFWRSLRLWQHEISPSKWWSWTRVRRGCVVPMKQSFVKRCSGRSGWRYSSSMTWRVFSHNHPNGTIHDPSASDTPALDGVSAAT
jgi:hypothetical protein